MSSPDLTPSPVSLQAAYNGQYAEELVQTAVSAYWAQRRPPGVEAKG